MDKVCVEIFKVRQAYELIDIGIIPDIPLLARIIPAPLFGRQSKEGHIEHIGFRSIDQINLLLAQFFRNKVFFYRISMYSVIDLCQIALDIPSELL